MKFPEYYKDVAFKLIGEDFERKGWLEPLFTMDSGYFVECLSEDDSISETLYDIDRVDSWRYI